MSDATPPLATLFDPIELEAAAAACCGRFGEPGAEAHRLVRVRDASVPIGSLVRGDTVFSETALSDEDRGDMRRRGVHWLDVGGQSRSAEGSSLTEELAGFLGRYGIRLPRD